MQGFKAQGAVKPTALGSLLQASCYGATIPEIIGQTQSPLLAIWAANLRQGGSTKKFKQSKKGITAYCENIDFLLGHNPIMGVLQIMVNGSNYPLNFTSQSFSYSGQASLEVSDSKFYFVTSVTLEVAYSFATNDYGAQGPQTLSGSFEVPLWNAVENGPDPTDNSSTRNWPFCYRWMPSDGATIYLDAAAQLPAGTLKIYYAQLMAATSYHPPLTKLRLAFENQLGSGSEYADAGGAFAAQQIIYPHFAGVGSSDIDLGASGAIPQLQPEVRGKWGIYPSGDADFADMIENIFKSGLAQAAIGIDQNYTQMERGLSSYRLPGCVQKKTVGLSAASFDRPVTKGNFLVVPYIAPSGAAIDPASISDSMGNVWTPVFPGYLGYQVWWAKANASGTCSVTIGNTSLTPPVTPGAGQSVAWGTNTPTVTLYSDGSGAVATETSATLTQLTGSPFNPAVGAQVVWNGFALPALPPGAVIDAMYIVANPLFTPSFGTTPNVLLAGASATYTSPYDGHLQSVSLGTDPSILGGLSIAATIGDTVAEGGATDSIFYKKVKAYLTFTELGLAVYFHVPGNAGPPTPQLGAFEIAGVDTFDAQVTSTSGAQSLTTSNQQAFDAYVLNLGLGTTGAAAATPDAKWNTALALDNFNSAVTGQPASPYLCALERGLRNPSTLSVASPLSAGLMAFCGLSFKATQPSSFPRPLGDFLDLPSLDLVRAQCRANGLWGSLSMSSQSAAADWLKSLYQAANAAPVYLGSKLYSFPYSEVSAAGNGALYTAPSAAGPVADLDADNGDFVGADGAPVLTTASRIKNPNILQMQCISREANYNQVVVQQPNAAAIALYGERKADPIVNNAIQDPTVARSILGVQVRRNQSGGDTWTFRASPRWHLLAPMDLITITDRLQGIVKVPVRLRSFNEQEDGSFQAEAEPFVYGMCAPTPLTAIAPTQNQNATGTSAGDVNAPVIFEPVPRLYGASNQAQLWLVVSSPATNYGGCQVFVSTDGGNSYNPAGDPLAGSAITGVTVADWAAAADPDTVNDLLLDLTESNGVLQSYLSSDEDNFVYPCYVAGGGGSAIPYELMTYALATLTATSKYTLKATGTGNHLRRAVYGAPAVGEGCDHPSGSRWAFLPPSAAGILKLPMDPTWIGKTLYFKICSFNSFGSALQGLSDVTAYSYTPTGGSGSVNPVGLPAQLFQINGV